MSQSLASPIFVFKQKDGTIKFSSKKPPGGVQALEFKARQSGFSYYKVKGYPLRSRGLPKKLVTDRFEDLIETAATNHGIDESLIRAVIHIESAFNPWAVSPKGARGLMQLMPQTARDLGVTNSFEVKQNINGGSKYLSWLLRRYNGNLTKAVAAYNAGPGAVDNYGGIPPYSETMAYVRNVLALKERYRAHQG